LAWTHSIIKKVFTFDTTPLIECHVHYEPNIMDILVLKLILAPVIIGSASLAGRKWGPAVSGWIVGMPLTSGPVIFFVALSVTLVCCEHGLGGQRRAFISTR
jgi:hypothetical protein